MFSRKLILFPSLAFLTACIAMSSDMAASVSRGQDVYSKECAQCHGPVGEGTGPASLGLGAPPPDLVGLKQRNGGAFPRDYVRRFVLGLVDADILDTAMPEFAQTGLRHVYPQGGADGEVLEADFEGLLDYLESIQN